MFELSQRLVGIYKYKTTNATRSVCIDNSPLGVKEKMYMYYVPYQYSFFILSRNLLEIFERRDEVSPSRVTIAFQAPRSHFRLTRRGYYVVRRTTAYLAS